MRRSAVLFLVIAVAQLAVPAWMIVAHERVLREGEVFKFRTAPIDPRDPFRGEYVVLSFEASSGAWSNPHPFPDAATDQSAWLEQTSYARLTVSDTSGYAVIAELLAEPPANGEYIRVEHWGAMGGSVNSVELPFDRYYMEEGDGAKTEKMLAPEWNDGVVTQPLPAYAKVRVYSGEAVIEDLIVSDRSIHEWLNAP